MEISRVAVVGAGFMGSGIAESCAAAGVEVTVYEPQAPPLQRSRERLAESTERAVTRGKLTAEAAEALRGRIAYTSSLDDLEGVDGVMEAVVEDPQVKGALFATLDERLPDARFLATNTSSIPIAQIASATRRPERVLGLHFFSPVPVMSLVEIVVGLDTDPATVALAEGFVTGLGKHPIQTRDRSGFVVNLLLVPYLMAAVGMYEDGFATAEDIDEGMKRGCGHPMGPLTLCDFIGLDVVCAIGDSLYDEFKRPEYAPTPLLKRMVAAGHLGRKTGRGFYRY